jgi:hypothetical protein
MMTKVGTFDLEDSAIWAIWSRQDLPEPQMETGGVSEEAERERERERERGGQREGRTLGEDGENGLDVCADVGRGRLGYSKVALAGRGSLRGPAGKGRGGECFAGDVLIRRAPVDVDDIARAMVHGLRAGGWRAAARL